MLSVLRLYQKGSTTSTKLEIQTNALSLHNHGKCPDKCYVRAQPWRMPCSCTILHNPGECPVLVQSCTTLANALSLHNLAQPWRMPCPCTTPTNALSSNNHDKINALTNALSVHIVTEQPWQMLCSCTTLTNALSLHNPANALSLPNPDECPVLAQPCECPIPPQP